MFDSDFFEKFFRVVPSSRSLFTGEWILGSQGSFLFYFHLFSMIVVFNSFTK